MMMMTDAGRWSDVSAIHWWIYILPNNTEGHCVLCSHLYPSIAIFSQSLTQRHRPIRLNLQSTSLFASTESYRRFVQRELVHNENCNSFTYGIAVESVTKTIRNARSPATTTTAHSGQWWWQATDQQWLSIITGYVDYCSRYLVSCVDRVEEQRQTGFRWKDGNSKNKLHVFFSTYIANGQTDIHTCMHAYLQNKSYIPIINIYT